MTQRVRLNSLEIRNYLGSGDEPLNLSLCGHHAVLCGPNGSGKTTLLSALDQVRHIDWMAALQSYSLNHNPAQMTLWDWFDVRPHFTGQLFHTGANKFQVRAEFLLPSGTEEHRRIEPLVPAHERALRHLSDHREATASSADQIRLVYSMLARSDQKAQLECITVEEEEFVKIGQSTRFATLISNEQDKAQGAHRYNLVIEDPREAFEPLKSLLHRIIYFPSNRQPRLGVDGDIGGMAAGEGLVSWIDSATNPDPRDTESARRHDVLQAFQDDFASFVGCNTVSLSVPRFSLPLRDNAQPEINVTVDGRLRQLSQLGAGIGESLIVMLVVKLSQEWRRPPIDIVMLEEPENHIHPTMQRKLLDRVAEYGVQIIAATHSPTVVNWFARNGGRIFRTELNDLKKTTAVRQVTELDDIRGLLEGIGVSHADVLLADRVLLVEGADDVPVFQAFLRKAPSFRGQNVVVLPVGGTAAAAENLDPKQWRNLHSNIRLILDSERRKRGDAPAKLRKKIKTKFEEAGIPCHLTERRATENYLSPRALRAVYGYVPDEITAYGDPNLFNQGVKQFEKGRNGEVARQMDWNEIENTDVGEAIEAFLNS
jgi:predicted ATPase